MGPHFRSHLVNHAVLGLGRNSGPACTEFHTAEGYIIFNSRLVSPWLSFSIFYVFLFPTDLRELDVNVFVGPFLDVIRSEDTTGPITGVALSAVNKFLSYGMIGKNK